MIESDTPKEPPVQKLQKPGNWGETRLVKQQLSFVLKFVELRTFAGTGGTGGTEEGWSLLI